MDYGNQAVQADNAFSPGHVRVYIRGDHQDGARKVAAGSAVVSKAGRNFRGKVTVHHRGGGHKRRYRIIDFRRDKSRRPGSRRVVEYDPNRSARIALLATPMGRSATFWRRLACRSGDSVVSGPEADIRLGNALAARATSLWVPSFTTLSCTLVAAVNWFARLAPGRRFWPKRARWRSCACLLVRCGWFRRPVWLQSGQVGNIERGNIKLGKAGRSRWMGAGPPRVARP